MQVLIDTLSRTQAGATIALLVLFLAWESIHPFFGFFRGQAKERGRHLLRNLLLGVINSAVVALGFVAAWALAAAWADAHDFGLLHLWRSDGAARVVAAVLILDAWTYVWHRLNHRVAFFWRFHRVHHADARMDVTTASRFHVGEIILSSILRIPVILLFGIRLWEILLFETMMFAVVQFHHANIGVPPALDRFLRAFIVTPAMHKVHHSRWQPETDSNFTSFLSVWDRIGGTFRLRERPEEIAFGLDGYDGPEHDSMRGLLRMPLDRAGGRNEAAPEPPADDR